MVFHIDSVCIKHDLTFQEFDYKKCNKLIMQRKNNIKYPFMHVMSKRR